MVDVIKVLIEKALIPSGLKAFISRRSNREKLKEKCGDKAFLMPSKLKFPVMDQNCNYHCGLIMAAYLRAREWGYNDIAKKAADLFEKNNCEEKVGRTIHEE